MPIRSGQCVNLSQIDTVSRVCRVFQLVRLITCLLIQEECGVDSSSRFSVILLYSRIHRLIGT
jgi:hypothetical protein